jgi:lipoate synthase
VCGKVRKRADYKCFLEILRYAKPAVFKVKMGIILGWARLKRKFLKRLRI